MGHNVYVAVIYMKKNKYLFLVVLTALGLVVGAIWANPKAARAQSDCTPGSIPTAVCIQDDAANCFTHDGTRLATCSNPEGHRLIAGHCYTERRGGPNGQLQGYTEITCESGGTDNPEPANAPADGSDTSSGEIDDTPVELECRNEGDQCSINDHLTTVVRVLSAMVGIVVTCMIAWGGLQYSSARDNPQQSAEAKNHILNAVIALVFYIFSIAILNWLVPGGVL
jgi:hypothetical protein